MRAIVIHADITTARVTVVASDNEISNIWHSKLERTRHKQREREIRDAGGGACSYILTLIRSIELDKFCERDLVSSRSLEEMTEGIGKLSLC